MTLCSAGAAPCRVSESAAGACSVSGSAVAAGCVRGPSGAVLRLGVGGGSGPRVEVGGGSGLGVEVGDGSGLGVDVGTGRCCVSRLAGAAGGVSRSATVVGCVSGSATTAWCVAGPCGGRSGEGTEVVACAGWMRPRCGGSLDGGRDFTSGRVRIGLAEADCEGAGESDREGALEGRKRLVLNGAKRRKATVPVRSADVDFGSESRAGSGEACVRRGVSSTGLFLMLPAFRGIRAEPSEAMASFLPSREAVSDGDRPALGTGRMCVDRVVHRQ